MEREHHRYMVLKYKDVVKHLTEDEQMALVGLANKVDAGRRLEGKQGPIECVVVEADWPEYLDTWSKIAARVDGVPFRQARMQQFRDYGVDGYVPAQRAPDVWLPIPGKHPTFDPVDLQLSDGSVLRGCVPQSDGDYWWEGPSGEVFIDPRYAPVTHWRLSAAAHERSEYPEDKP